MSLADPKDRTEPAFRSGWRDAAVLLRGPFRVLVAGQALGQFADGLTQVAFAQLVVFDIGRGATPGLIAAVLAVTLLPFSVVGPLAGVLIDRWDRRHTLVAASLSRAALAVVAVSAASWRSEVLAYVGVVLLLSSSRFVLDAKGAVLPRTVSASDLVRANAISGLLGMAAAFTGALVGAAVASQSVTGAFGAGAVGYVAASRCFARLPNVGGGTQRDSTAVALRRLRGELGAGFGVIARTAELRRPIVTVTLHRLLLGAGFVLLVLAVDRSYHLQASGYALAIAVTGVAAVAGTVIAPWLSGRWHVLALLPLAFLPPAGVAAAVGFGPSLIGLVTVLAVAALSFQTLKTVADALVGRAAPDALRGRVVAIYDVGYNVAFVLAGLVMMPLWELRRERALLWWLAAAFAVGWLVSARVAHAWPFRPARAVGRPAAEPAARRWRIRATALACGAVLVVAFPRAGLWWAAWFALVPWLILVRRAPSAREAAARGWWAALGFLLAVQYWLVPSTGPFVLIIGGVLAALWLPWAALTWRVMSRPLTGRRLVAAFIVVPSGWVLVEAARSWAALGGPWGLLGASQWNNPATLASASLGGVWLVSFLIVAVNVAITAVIVAPSAPARLTALAGAVALYAAGPAWHAAEPPLRGTATFPVAVVEGGVVHSGARRLADELAATGRLPPDRYRLVVWGESSISADVLARPDVRHPLATLAARLRTELLVNSDTAAGGTAIHKTAVLIDRSGIRASYEKIRLVPFGEYLPLHPIFDWLTSITKAARVEVAPGRRLTVMRVSGVRVAPLICFESAFPDMSRSVVRSGADVLVFQTATTTFQGSWAPDQQAALAAVRAVETGRPALQASLAGTSAAFDGDGHRLLWHPGATGTATVTLPLTRRDTPFDRLGDWVPAGSVIAVTVAVGALSLAAARRSPDVRTSSPAPV